MAQPADPAVGDRRIYHFTHVDNLGAIRAAGLLRCDSVAREGMTRTEVGDPDIKESRRRRVIPIEPGGRERWNSTPEDLDRQRRRQTEFLVYGELPLTVIRWVAVQNDDLAARVGKLLVDHALGQRIIVRPNWYYGYERR